MGVVPAGQLATQLPADRNWFRTHSWHSVASRVSARIWHWPQKAMLEQVQACPSLAVCVAAEQSTNSVVGLGVGAALGAGLGGSVGTAVGTGTVGMLVGAAVCGTSMHSRPAVPVPDSTVFRNESQLAWQLPSYRYWLSLQMVHVATLPAAISHVWHEEIPQLHGSRSSVNPPIHSTLSTVGAAVGADVVGLAVGAIVDTATVSLASHVRPNSPSPVSTKPSKALQLAKQSPWNSYSPSPQSAQPTAACVPTSTRQVKQLLPCAVQLHGCPDDVWPVLAMHSSDATVGTPVGINVGAVVGTATGAKVGDTVGRALGVVVGAALGAGDGLGVASTGASVGLVVGCAVVGCAVGESVGLGVTGDSVGARVGLAVGSAVSTQSAIRKNDCAEANRFDSWQHECCVVKQPLAITV